jgi:hypothetical protein
MAGDFLIAGNLKNTTAVDAEHGINLDEPNHQIPDLA